jgi:hypothetical protein
MFQNHRGSARVHAVLSSGAAALNERHHQEHQVWQADCRQLPSRSADGSRLPGPWVVLVTSQTCDLILAYQVFIREPVPDELWDTLVRAMCEPAMGKAGRPTELQVRPDRRWQPLTPRLEAIGIRLAVTEGLDQIEVVLRELGGSSAAE